ncbi:FAD-dependent monooxygenase [Halalkalibacter urbisdiaboli]|uniref:FAD-dependent monooxygenase n=1 Tax=Halalkalibacter urbisdiaboli TaxID=1960589 RepID=UPI000B44CB62|nr:FAD-dependent monooxygenase [Halalkalibacter urbisdiaboli]
MKKKVLIIGAGVSGLASALMLEKIGYAPVIFEKSDGLRNDGGGLTLWSNATDALHSMGLLEEIYQNSKIMSETALTTSSGKTLATIPLEELATKYGTHTVGILRANLHHILASKLKQTEIKIGYKLVNLKETNDEVIARLENGHEEAGDLLVGADGIYSAVRNKLFPNHALRFSGYEAWRGIATYTNQYTKSGFTFEAWGNGMRFGFVPMSNSLVYWYATRKTSENLSKNQISKEQLIHSFREFAEPVPTVIEETKEKDITRKVIYDLKPLQNWSKGRVVLIGDAAHATTPNLGQGACMALEDAVILAQTLEQDNSISQAVKTFEDMRMDRAKLIVNSSWMFGKIAQIENTFLCDVRNMLVKIGSSIKRNSNLNRIIGHKI